MSFIPFFSALKCDECGAANVVCDVPRISLYTEQPHPLSGSCDRGHETIAKRQRV